MSVFKQMGFPPSTLENLGHVLSGFNGASTTSLGDIMLPIRVRPVILNVQFSMIDDLSPFNAIMGRTWLHDMKAIPFTYHQIVSYLTEKGQINLYGSQLAAHQCYQVAREAGSNSDNEPPIGLMPYPHHDLFSRKFDASIRINKRSLRMKSTSCWQSGSLEKFTILIGW